MPIVTPTDIDWIEIDDSGPLVDWIDFADKMVSPLEDRKVRDAHLLVPGKTGVYPLPGVIDALDATLLGDFYGHRPRDGGADIIGRAAGRTQLRDNRDFLVAEVFDPPGTADGTRTLSLHLADEDESVYSGPVLITGRLGVVGDTPISQAFALSLLVVDGGLLLEGS